MLTLTLAVSLPFVLACAYGLLLAQLLVQHYKPQQAFLLAFTLGLVGGGPVPGLLSASILESSWLRSSLTSQPWLDTWQTLSTFVLAPFLSATVAALGARAFAARRAAAVGQNQ